MKPEELQKAEWREIPGVPGYLVSEFGQVIGKRFPSTIRVGTTTPRGYVAQSVMLNGKPKIFRTHRLVAWAFIGPSPSPEHQINHIDGDKSNNHYSNLEWVTSRDNLRHSVETLGNKSIKEIGQRRKLDWAQALTVKTLKGHSWYNSRNLGRHFGLNASNVLRIWRGETYADL